MKHLQTEITAPKTLRYWGICWRYLSYLLVDSHGCCLGPVPSASTDCTSNKEQTPLHRLGQYRLHRFQVRYEVLLQILILTVLRRWCDADSWLERLGSCYSIVLRMRILESLIYGKGNWSKQEASSSEFHFPYYFQILTTKCAQSGFAITLFSYKTGRSEVYG